MNARTHSLWNVLSGRAAPLFVIAACALAYANALAGPFVFDDLHAIVENELLPPTNFSEWFSAPAGSTASGRPLVAFSFALNHSLFGDAVTGWHATNLALHALCALALLGLVRETLNRTGHEHPGPVAFAVAILWSVHPLLTDAVDLVASRSELLVSLAYLLVLLCLSKAADAKSPWTLLCVLACALGMASKEVMVTAPLIALAWDRTFLSGSWRAAWTARRGLHLTLAGTWLMLAACVFASDRGASVSLGGTVVSTWESLCTQAGAIVHYLRLFFWPSPLSIDYAGWPVARDLSGVLPQALVLLALGAIASRRFLNERADGLIGVVFFAILLPSSSVIPLTGELVAEHRMYLASAALVTLVVLAVHRRLGSTALLAATVLLTPALLYATRARNEDWSSARSIWESAIETRPTNARAWNSLGLALEHEGRLEEAAGAWRTALEHDPDDYHAHGNLGEHYVRTQDPELAIHHYARAIEGRDDHPELLFNLGSLLLATGDAVGAETRLTQALQIAPDSWSLRELAKRRLAAARRQQ